MAVLQHVHFEGPAAIADWAVARQIPLTVSHLYRGDPLPHTDTFDMLAVMGGPMSANDGAQIPWLEPEINLVGHAIATKKIVLGVCLGSQIIAKALGASVHSAPHKEIGWFPVQRTENAHPILAGLPEEFMAFHWHGETFDLPAEAIRLARTEATENQAFALGDRVLGLQFHLEATKESVSALVENAAADIGCGEFEQAPSAILDGIPDCPLPGLRRMLDNLTGFAVAGK